MENIAGKYQSRARRRHTAAMAGSAFALAAVANLFLFSDAGKRMQASLTDAVAPAAAARADLYLEKEPSGVVRVVAGTDIPGVSEISFSLATDPSLVDMKGILASEGSKADVTMITRDSPYVATVRLPAAVKAGETVATVLLSKKRPVDTPVNITDTFFKKAGQLSELTNEGLASY